jgi:hypothetical protein
MIFARQSNEPAHNEPSFVRDFHYLTALIQHLVRMNAGTAELQEILLIA